MNDDFDDLDRALFALPLEAPPAGLRASIMNATVYANVPRTAASLVAPWEIWVCGVSLAVVAWLLIAAVNHQSYAAVVIGDIISAVRVFAVPATLSWFAVGCVLAATVWYLGDSTFRLPTRSARS
jgi:hypothetical protein